MSQFKILMDTNVYLRLAQSLHPLLFDSFGTDNNTLYLIDGFQKEFDRNPRLKSSFFWVNDSEYTQNREYSLTISNAEKKNIKIAESYLWNENLTEGRGASKVDVEALAYALVLGIPIVTDDGGMVELAKGYGITVWGIIDLLDLMYKNQHIDLNKIAEIGDYLFHSNDLPFPSFLKDLKKRFKGLPSFK